MCCKCYQLLFYILLFKINYCFTFCFFYSRAVQKCPNLLELGKFLQNAHLLAKIEIYKIFNKIISFKNSKIKNQFRNF